MSTSVISDSMMYLREYISDLLDSILETDYSDRVFSGVMNRDDFVDYVAFEVCTEQYLQSAKTFSLLQHIQRITDDHKNYLLDLQCMNQQSKKLKNIEDFSTENLYHGLRPYLSDMIDRRSAELNQANHSSAPAVFSFDSSDPNQHWKGYPITTVHFLQAYTSYALGVKHVKYALRLADKNFNSDKARLGYERQDYFLEFISLPLYRNNFTDEECDRYIANAINLNVYENRYFRNTLYTYASQLPDTKNCPNFLSGTVPPILLGSIVTENALGHCLAADFLSWHFCIYGSCTWNMNVRKPYLFMKDYARIFASAEDSQQLEEELRYYAIQILAARLIRLVRNCHIVSNVTPKEFASFIHHRYNIADEMLQQAAIHEETGFNKNIVSAMRAITRDLTEKYGFVN